jgi:sugar phosphate permease
MPSLTILSISFICMVVFMAEGCVADWSAIYLKETLHGPEGISKPWLWWLCPSYDYWPAEWR